MIARSGKLPIFAATLMLGACTQTPGEITRDTQPFGGIGESENVSLLGTEPFWGLEIEPAADANSYTANYSTPENIDGTDFPVSRFAGNNGLGFNGEMSGEAVQVTVTPEDCGDGMSDRTYPFTATVAVGDLTLHGCGYSSEHPFSGDEMP